MVIVSTAKAMLFWVYYPTINIGVYTCVQNYLEKGNYSKNKMSFNNERNLKMKWFLKLSAISLVAIFINGCIEMHTVITVKKDGSGLVEENIFVGKEVINMFKVIVNHVHQKLIEY